MSEMNRRAFLVTAATAAAAVISLPVLQPQAFAADVKPVDVGKVADYTKDGVTDTWQKTNKMFVIREDNKIYACLSLCTHKGVQLQVKDDDLYCPKHGSHFTFEGTVTKGPAKSSLVRYAIKVGDDGKIMVDQSKSFEEKKWDDKDSFVDVPKAA